MSDKTKSNNNRPLPGLTVIKKKKPPIKEVVASLRELEAQLPEGQRRGVTKAISLATESEE